jgi:hypothetical protein
MIQHDHPTSPGCLRRWRTRASLKPGCSPSWEDFAVLRITRRIPASRHSSLRSLSMGEDWRSRKSAPFIHLFNHHASSDV